MLAVRDSALPLKRRAWAQAATVRPIRTDPPKRLVEAVSVTAATSPPPDVTRGQPPPTRFRLGSGQFTDSCRAAASAADSFGPLALRTPSDTLAALLDPITGTVRGLARFRNGARVKEYNEAPWGDAVADTGLVVRYRFAGREWDQESGLYYMRARYYDPTLGRWVSEDPIGLAGGGNLFGYARGDPVNGRDPSGLSGECVYHSMLWGTYTDAHGHVGFVTVWWIDCQESGSLPAGQAPIGNKNGAAAPGPPRDEAGVGNREKGCSEQWMGFGMSLVLDATGVRPLGAAVRAARAAYTGRASLAAGYRLAWEAGRRATVGSDWMLTARTASEAIAEGNALLGTARFEMLRGGLGAGFMQLAPEFSLLNEGLRGAPFGIGSGIRLGEAIDCSLGLHP